MIAYGISLTWTTRQYINKRRPSIQGGIGPEQAEKRASLAMLGKYIDYQWILRKEPQLKGERMEEMFTY